MRILLDTHALLWWLTDDANLSRVAHAAIADEGNTIYVSAATAWEISTKVRLGKLSDVALGAGLGAELSQQGFQSLDISVQHAERAGMLPGPLKDPFDRMLIAQAHLENLLIVSNESAFDTYGVNRIW